MPGAGAEANGVVEPFARQVDAVVVGEQAQVDARMRGVEGGEPGKQPAGGEGAHRGHREQLCGSAAGDALDQLGDAIEAVPQRGEQRQPFVGERKPARQAAEELGAQALLQALHLVADRGLRHAQLDRGAGEAQMPCRCLEGAQGIEGEVGADHRAPSISSANAGRQWGGRVARRRATWPAWSRYSQPCSVRAVAGSFSKRCSAGSR